MSTNENHNANCDGDEIPLEMTGAVSLSSAIASLKSNNPTEPGEEASTEAEQEEDMPSEGSQLEYPGDLRMAVEDQRETKQKALVVRRGKNHDDAKPLVLDSIVVQSPSLKKTQGEAFEGYTGITASLKKLVFKAPFHPFYYRWKTFSRTLERQRREDPDAAAYTQLLYDLLSGELMEDMNEIEDHVRQGVITYRLLSALFEPGSQIVTAPMLKEYPKKGYFEVHAKCIDWDGTDFGYANIMLPIFQFGGTRRINELLVFPVSFHSSKDNARSNAIARGRIFQELHGVHYRAYSGAMLLNNGDEKAERNVDGRIVIDAVSYLDSHPDEKRALDALDDDSIMPALETSDDCHITDAYRYSLKLKKWGMFDVTKVTSITWNNDAFSHLMLPTGYKNLILSFVEGQATSKKAFDDVIKGKGLAILMLLVGSPGTGKTLTAEAVADRVRQPLYMLSAGALGQSAEDIENRLSDILRLTEKWDAVLLFDECDVFLQERSVRHLHRTRFLQYFFAFKSRIHLILHYPELVPQAKEQIWRQFVNRSNSQNYLTDEAYSRLAALPMNGRQIKNVVQIATLLAGEEKNVLGIDQVRIVLQATKEVDDEGI
ncbi:P-loop containing nucleoside triphosphate hydrolase protein [Aspergillus minisclerotigenes]|uniref:P-loop containing nucleoside triphosphate hydrolase protein n=1 Tax=Aspergillus minisclerotigenes TaxID=656917 RepID=A0A5N6IU86_9EURO|nr:P-loop containing nucleoside triphosphate hydrolase protein [Aspergillus minisclerotigenes]